MDAASPRRWTLPDWVGLAARLVLGGVLLVAGGLKVANFGESIYAVRSYQLLPWGVTEILGYALPIVEVAVGLLLIVGLFTRLSGIAGAGMMLAFIVAIASVWARGISIDCGCFGGGGEVSREAALAAYPWEIARDIALMACGVWLAVRPRTPFALDQWLFRPIEGYAPGEDEDAASHAPGSRP